jgi:hypothetical protein
MKYAFAIIIIAITFFTGYFIARAVNMTLAVPAWYDCKIVGYDLECTTNVQHIKINGRMFY